MGYAPVSDMAVEHFAVKPTCNLRRDFPANATFDYQKVFLSRINIPIRFQFTWSCAPEPRTKKNKHIFPVDSLSSCFGDMKSFSSSADPWFPRVGETFVSIVSPIKLIWWFPWPWGYPQSSSISRWDIP